MVFDRGSEYKVDVAGLIWWVIDLANKRRQLDEKGLHSAVLTCHLPVYSDFTGRHPSARYFIDKAIEVYRRLEPTHPFKQEYTEKQVEESYKLLKTAEAENRLIVVTSVSEIFESIHRLGKSHKTRKAHKKT